MRHDEKGESHPHMPSGDHGPERDGAAWHAPTGEGARRAGQDGGAHDHNHGHADMGGHGAEEHGHGAEHGHGHGGHDHAPRVDRTNERRILFVFAITAGYAVVQAAGGLIAGSLALVADAGHMVSDAAALLLALVAYRVARRGPDARASYGYHRVRVLAALVNGGALLLLVAWIAWEAVRRLAEPVEVLAGPMLIVALVGLVVNVVGAMVLRRGGQEDQNLHGAFLHVLGDLLGSVGAIAASIGIMLTGWMPLDPILSVLVAALVLRSAWGLVAQSVAVLIQGMPRGLSASEILADLETLPEVAEAGHFHAWTLTDARIVATVHVTPAEGADPLALPALVAAHLSRRFGVGHATVEVDPPGAIPPVATSPMA